MRVCHAVCDYCSKKIEGKVRMQFKGPPKQPDLTVHVVFDEFSAGIDICKDCLKKLIRFSED